MAILKADTFVRSNAATWTPASDAEVWTLKAGTTWRILSNRGNIYSSSGSLFATLGAGIGDYETVFRWRNSVTTTNMCNTSGWIVRYLASTDYLILRFYWDTLLGSIQLGLLQKSNNVNTYPVRIPYALTANTDYYWRIRLTGWRVQARVWLASGSEPSTWDIDYTIADATFKTRIGTTGLVGIYGYANDSVGINVDGLTVSDPVSSGPQTITCGVATAVTTGRTPTVVQPAIPQTITCGVATAVASAYAPKRPGFNVVFTGDVQVKSLAADSTNSRGRVLRTSALALAANPDVVIIGGDDTYNDPAAYNVGETFDVSWGRLKGITYSARGNHDVVPLGGTDCSAFDTYWGTRGGTHPDHWFVVDLQASGWYVVIANASQSTLTGSAQYTAIAAWIAARPGRPFFAVIHVPLWSAGETGDDSAAAIGGTSQVNLWSLLTTNHCEFVLSGHNHDYERYPLRLSNGTSDPSGARLFVCGLGGYNFSDTFSAGHGQTVGWGQPRSAGNGNVNCDVPAGASTDNEFGILSLQLFSDHYEWTFLGIDSYHTDAGTQANHIIAGAVTQAVGSATATIQARAAAVVVAPRTLAVGAASSATQARGPVVIKGPRTLAVGIATGGMVARAVVAVVQARTIAVGAATSTTTARSATAVRGALIRAVGAATSSSAARPPTIVRGAISRAVGAASSATLARATTAVRGALVRVAAVASLTVAPRAVVATTGALARLVGASTAATGARAVSVITSGSTVVAVGAANGTATVRPATATVGGRMLAVTAPVVTMGVRTVIIVLAGRTITVGAPALAILARQATVQTAGGTTILVGAPHLTLVALSAGHLSGGQVLGVVAPTMQAQASALMVAGQVVSLIRFFAVGSRVFVYAVSFRPTVSAVPQRAPVGAVGLRPTGFQMGNRPTVVKVTQP